MDPLTNPTDDQSYVIAPKDKGVIAPLSNAQLKKQNDPANMAAEVIRQRIAGLYAKEPDVKIEAAEAEDAGAFRSKHQVFVQQLTSSGKSLAEIQTAWHNYYVALPDDEKHQVWREFYANQNRASAFMQQLQKAAQPAVQPTQPAAPAPRVAMSPTLVQSASRTVGDLKKQLLGRINTRGKLQHRQHIKSLAFGLSMGSVVILILLFSFFNERFIAPFITPSRTVSSTPVIVDPNDVSAGPVAEVIIPKINVEIPVVYGNSIDESTIDKDLEHGVVHYATTPKPGEQGNVAVVGHSSNNILNPGKYKFAFVLLSRLDSGDLFSLTRDGKRYTYKVYKKEIVKPTDVHVLGPADKPATATLITCDPPGTSLNRLVVVGEQISPDPGRNTASTALKTDKGPVTVPGNAPSLWHRLVSWLTG